MSDCISTKSDWNIATNITTNVKFVHIDKDVELSPRQEVVETWGQHVRSRWAINKFVELKQNDPIGSAFWKF